MRLKKMKHLGSDMMNGALDHGLPKNMKAFINVDDESLEKKRIRQEKELEAEARMMDQPALDEGNNSQQGARTRGRRRPSHPPRSWFALGGAFRL
jgi:hypothetical protein